MKPGPGHRSWTESHVMQSLAHICNTAANNTEDYVKGEKKKACQNPNISDRKARRPGPSGPMLDTSCLLPTSLAFPWTKLPHMATEEHFASPASSAFTHIWLHHNQEGIWGQVIFICTKCLLGSLQEMVPC